MRQNDIVAILQNLSSSIKAHIGTLQYSRKSEER